MDRPERPGALTTEVVLSRFRGELTLLGGRGEAGGDPGPDYGDEPAWAARSGRHRRAAPAGGQGRGKPATLADDLDDDIPF